MENSSCVNCKWWISLVQESLFVSTVTTIDYLNSKLYLNPYKNETFRSRYNLLDLELRQVISGNFVVRFIFPELVAASSALQEIAASYKINQYDFFSSVNWVI